MDDDDIVNTSTDWPMQLILKYVQQLTWYGGNVGIWVMKIQKLIVNKTL